MKKIPVVFLCFAFLFFQQFSLGAEKAVRPHFSREVLVLTLDGAIGAPAASYLSRGISQAEKEEARLVVIQLNTPGGSGDAMMKIMAKIDNSTVPVCVFVYPRGAMAASAGMYIAESSQYIAMSPQTTIGAAHPVSGGGGDIQGDERAKVTNTFVATAKTHAKRYGRNVDWVEKAVRKSVSITEEEALKLHVIDLVANDISDLLTKLDGKKAQVLDGTVVLHTKNAAVKQVPMTFIEHVLLTVTHPEIVLILFMLGFYGLLYELMSPGAVLPGVVGAISLLLAFYAMGTLPVNYAGVFLILLSFLLFLLELKMHTHGIMTVGGTVSLIFGSFLLVESGVKYSATYYAVVAATVVFSLSFVFLVLAKLWNVRRQRQLLGKESLIGELGVVKEPLTPEGYVSIEGVLWKAKSQGGPISQGMKVKVVQIEDSTLVVRQSISI